jgi:YD repeat-containing protein
VAEHDEGDLAPGGRPGLFAMRRVARLDAEGRADYYQYDAAGRMTSRLQQGVGASYFGYDANGNRTLLQEGEGTTYWSFDNLDHDIREEGL